MCIIFCKMWNFHINLCWACQIYLKMYFVLSIIFQCQIYNDCEARVHEIVKICSRQQSSALTPLTSFKSLTTSKMSVRLASLELLFIRYFVFPYLVAKIFISRFLAPTLCPSVCLSGTKCSFAVNLHLSRSVINQ